MNEIPQKYIKNHLKEIEENNWYQVFPISISQDILDFDDVDEIYESLVNAGIYIDLETLFKQDYNFKNYILRNKDESFNEFENRALTQFYKETTVQLASLFNEHTFGYIIDSLRASFTLPIQDYDLSGNRNTKPTEVKLEIILSPYGYSLYNLRFINSEMGEELQFRIESEIIEANTIYFPYGIGYNLSKVKNDMGALIQELEKEIIG